MPKFKIAALLVLLAVGVILTKAVLIHQITGYNFCSDSKGLLLLLIVCGGLTLSAFGIWRRQKWVEMILPLVVAFVALTSLQNLVNEFRWNVFFGILVLVHAMLPALALALMLTNRENFWRTFYSSHPAATVVVFNALALCFIFSVVEANLKSLNYQPGIIIKTPHFNKVKQLVLKEDYTVDSNGIMVISRKGRNYIDSNLLQNRYALSDWSLNNPYSFYTVKLACDFYDLKNGKVNNEFSNFIDRLNNKPPSDLTDADAAYLVYSKSPINETGFRSIEFKSYSGVQKKILLIGDSFTWGHSADNFTSGFADILATRNFILFNASMSGADPAQYLAIAEKYIPLLQPDVVVVNFFMGNDVMNFHREVSPEHIIFYPTNAGNLYTCPGGEYLPTPESTYRFVLNEYSIPQQENNFFNRLCGKTVITTQLWILLNRWGWVNNEMEKENRDYWERTKPLRFEKPVSASYLKKIREVCRVNNAEFFLFVIPEADKLSADVLSENPDLFEDLDFYMPELTMDDYNLKDGHFNDSGHRKYADFILSKMNVVSNQ